MNLDTLDTKSRIILVTMDMIGSKGNIDLTIREIAQEANVNIASINYYFGSKDNLFYEVEKRFVDDIGAIYEILFKDGESYKERLIQWATSLMTYLINYPGIIFMWAARLINDKTQNQGIVELIASSESNLNHIVKGLTQIDDDEQVIFKIMQLISGIINPVIIYQGVGSHMGVDISDDNIRSKYVISLIESVICKV